MRGNNVSIPWRVISARKRLWCAVAILLAAGAPAQSQTPASEMRFDAASVKRNLTDTQATLHAYPGGVTITGMTLRALIATAYAMRADRIVGLPGWASSDRFDIAARSSVPARINQHRLMLRVLLSERFGLATHHEERQQHIYALVVARANTLGSKLTPSSECASAGKVTSGRPPSADSYPCGVSTFIDTTGTVIRGGAASISDLARTLDGTGGRFVSDRTGLQGTYNFELRFAPPRIPGTAPDNSELPDVFTALQEQLGLKLDPRSGSVQFLVIDTVNAPTPD